MKAKLPVLLHTPTAPKLLLSWLWTTHPSPGAPIESSAQPTWLPSDKSVWGLDPDNSRCRTYSAQKLCLATADSCAAHSAVHTQHNCLHQQRPGSLHSTPSPDTLRASC